MEKIILQLFLLITFSTSANHFSSPELKDYSEAVMATTTSVANGNWTNSGIWSNGVPNANTRAIIGNNTTVNIVGNHNAQEVVVHGVLQVTENNTNKSLRTRWIHVNSDGIFRIGTAGNRYNQSNFTVTLTGTNPNADHSIPLANGSNLNIQNNDGFLMAAGGGRLQFFGEDKISFTKLTRTANAGTNRITVANIIDRNHSGALSGAHDGVFNWQVGDQIVIASSVMDYTQEDVRTITNIQNQGANRVLTLNRALTYRHYGEIETYGNDLDPMSNNIIGGSRSIDMRAEVALLSRKVKIQGLASQDTDNNFGDRARLQTGSNGKATNGVGGHIMIMPTAGQISVEGVQLDLMGQAGRLGRYPFHWHLARNRSGDVFRNSSITNSNNRAVVVHTANNVLVEGIVAHDIHGHGFFTEDGVEEDNRFINNIAFGIHRVHKDNDRNGAAFVVDNTDNFLDRGKRSRTTAAFWIANANNEFIGNVVAGSEGSGYWFGQPGKPRGASRDIPEFSNYNPRAHALKAFRNNAVHSSQTGLVVALSPEIGTPDGMSSGEFNQFEIVFNNVDPVYENFTVYQSGVGLYPLVTNVRHTFINFKAADNYTSNFDSDPTLIRNGLMIGRSRGNPNTGEVNGNTFYHGQTYLENVHIAGFGESGTKFFRTWGGNRVRSGYEVEKLTYENDGTYINMRKSSHGDRVNVDIYDRDGSLTTGFGGGSGYSFMMTDDFNIDESAGDIRGPGRFSYSVTRSRFANLQTSVPQTTTYNPRVIPGNDPRDAPRMVFTAPHGVSRDIIHLGRGRFCRQLKIGQEYTVAFPDGINFSTEKLMLTLHQWSMRSNSVGVTLHMPGQANRMRPQNNVTRRDLPRVNSLSLLRNANRDTYYTAGNGDLYVKIMNRGQGIHENYIYFEQGAAPTTSGICDFTPINGKALDIGSGLGKMFVVGTNRRIYERRDNNWVILPDGGFQADRVDVGGGGQAMVVATDGKIYRFSPSNQWVLVSGSATDVGANRNALYVIGNGGIVYKRNSNPFNWIQINPSVRAKKLDVYVDGNAWIIGTDGFVYQLINNNWFRKGTFKARDIGIAEGTGNIWALSESDGSLYFYEGSQVWSKQSDQTGNHISVRDDNRIWVVDGQGNVLFSDCEANNGVQQRLSSLDNDFQVTPQLNQKADLNFKVYQLKHKPIDQINFQCSHEDKNDFETISVVSPTDLVDGTEEYNWIHDNPKVGMNYYRVKIEYSDGTEIISNFGEAHFIEGVASFSIAPNPAQNYINMDLSELMDQNIHYIISSLNGKVVLEGNFDKDHNELETINLEGFNDGIYVIYTKQGQGKKFIIMKN